MTTGNTSDNDQSGVCLAGSYSGESSTPSAMGFRYGTSSSLSTYSTVSASAGAGADAAGSFSATLTGLSAGTTYYYQAYVTVSGTGDYASQSRTILGGIKSFTTKPSAAYLSSYLGHYEVPATDVALTSGSYHSRVSETNGDSYAYIFNPFSSSRRIVTHTYIYNGKEVCNYTMLYDQTKKCALWVAWEMDKDDHADKNVGRNDAWGYDPAIPQSWQPNLSSAYNGYSRGHQVASSDRQTTVSANNQTFYYSNMAPQLSTFNSGAVASLETAIQGLLPKLGSNEKLFVVTGPIFGTGASTTTDKSGVSCPVPTQFYKCVMKCSVNSSGVVTSAQGCAYLFDHVSETSRQIKTIDQIESLTGFDFFANLPDSLESSAESMTASFF